MPQVLHLEKHKWKHIVCKNWLWTSLWLLARFYKINHIPFEFRDNLLETLLKLSILLLNLKCWGFDYGIDWFIEFRIDKFLLELIERGPFSDSDNFIIGFVLLGALIVIVNLFKTKAIEHWKISLIVD